jgi:hypothetical protein
MVTLAVLGGVTIFGGTVAALINPAPPTVSSAALPKAVSPSSAAPSPVGPGQGADAGAATMTKDGSS